MTAYVDTCILIDVLDPQAANHQWSLARLNEAKQNGPVLVSDIVYSEFSVALQTVEEVDEVINALDLQRCGYSNVDLFAAGKAFAIYRKNEGQKLNVLPDFFIGAIAKNNLAPVITRDVQRFTTYFPEVNLIAP